MVSLSTVSQSAKAFSKGGEYIALGIVGAKELGRAHKQAGKVGRMRSDWCEREPSVMSVIGMLRQLAGTPPPILWQHWT